MSGIELLTEFRRTRSEQAFTALVRQYTNLVYSVAQRRVSSVPLAQEVTQSVFIRLATSVPNLSSDAQLAAWLHRTTVHVSIDLWRAESRRRTREEHVAAMQTETVEEPAWAQLAPALDDALNKLEEAERQVLLLRFFEQRSMRELGGCLGISEDAAKMRVSRATDKLRTRLKATGLACTATGLTTLMAEHSVAAAPAAVITALSQLQVPVAPTLFQAMAHAVAHGLKSKAALGSIAALVVAGLFVSSAHPWNRGTDAASNATAGAGLQSPEGRGNKDQASQGVGTNLPDPRKLLQMASSARERILSGEMKLITTYYGFERPLDGTNTQQIQVLFDRGNLRFDTVGHEYRYTSMERDAREVTDAKRKAQGLTREAAEQAGLLQGFDSHQVTIFDGNRRLEYRETSDGQKSATIDSSDHGGSAYLFDPRVIGLTSTPQAGQSPEDCLGWRTAKSVELVGKEELLGVPCWHVRVSDGFNVWIDAENPICIRKYSWSEDTVISQFDENTPKDPLPRFVRKVSTRNGAPRYETSIRLLDVKINTAVDAASFTLAGLGMKPGTDVADVRIHRRIGSWNGSGLTPDHSEEKGKDTNVVSRSETMRTLEMEPASAAGREAAVWVLLNTPDGPEVQQAADVILANHLSSTNLLGLAKGMDRMRHSCSSNLLTALMVESPVLDIRGHACFTLASILKDNCKFGTNQVVKAAAIKLFERAVSDFSAVKERGYSLAELAKPELADLQRLSIGDPAPETTGEDLNGQSLHLSDYRGKIIAVVTWGHCGGCRPNVDDLKYAEENLAGKPFAIVGVYTDNHPEEAKEIAEQIGFTWPCFKEGRDGPIATAWHMQSWPTVSLIDQEGRIARREIPEHGVVQAVERLIENGK